MSSEPATTNGSGSAPAAGGAAPALLDLTIDNITPNTIRINSQSPDARLTYVMARLVQHLHDFARETRLSSEEWMAALDFLVACGQISTDVRHEFILLSDILGLSLLVDNINHPKADGATEGSVLGPFHTHDAPELALGSNMSYDAAGKPLLAVCRVLDTRGNPVEGVKIDIWETDSSGKYDVQHAGRDEPSERCVMRSDADGNFWFRGIRPVSYPIPHDGPVGKLLKLLRRHPWRPAHMHFMFEKDGWDKLVTALYVRGDPYESTDAVFGVKQSLMVDLGPVTPELAAQHGCPADSCLLRYDFVMITDEESAKLRDEQAVEALARLGLTHMRLIDHLPVPDLD